MSDWRPRGVLRWGVVAIAFVVTLAVLTAFVLRIGYALELEWMEGGVMHQALRLQRGESIYPIPSPDFVPFLYTPLYPAVLAALGTVFGLDYPVGRAVSIVACIAIAHGVWRAVGREGKPVAHRAAAVGLFAAGYVFAFRWLDLARPDALYLALTLWGLILLRDAWGDHRKAIAAGVLVALGFWTKQTAATFVIASAVGALLVAPRQLWSYALTIAVIDGGGVLIGDSITEGRLWHYIYELHQTHAFNEERFTTKSWGMLVHALPFSLLAIAAGLVEFLRPWLAARRRLDPQETSARKLRLQTSRGTLYWGLMAATALLVSALGYSTQWAEPNAFLPAVLFLALFAAVVTPVGSRTETIGLVAMSLQMVFGLLVEPMYQPIQTDGWAAGVGRSYAWQRIERTVPTAQARGRAQQLRTEIEAAPGEVFALQRPWWSVLAGGSGHVGSMGLKDVDQGQGEELRRAIAEQISSGRYAQIWLEGEPPRWLRRALSSYRVERRLHGADRVRPMSGYMSEAGMVTPYRKDQVLWVRVEAREPPAGGEVVADFEDGTLQGFEVTGDAFGRRPSRGFVSRLPAVGPYGGEYLLSSATARGRLEATGRAESPPFVLPESGYLEMLLGTSGRSRGLTVELVGDRGVIQLPIPRTRYWLEPVRWEIESGWGGAQIQLRLADESPEASLWLDDLWVVAPP